MTYIIYNMTALLILALLILLFMSIYSPFIDIFKDYTGKNHIIIWYNYKGKRNFIDLLGGQ